jgi:1,2-diacylglycerol 3-alpha-glucosyltransferase
MNILMVSDVYFPRVNGVSTSIRTFVRALVRMGHRVTLVAPDYGAGEEQCARDVEFGDAFQVLRLPARVLFFDPEDRLFTRRAMREAFDTLSKGQWDVVHVHTPFRGHALGVRVARARGVPVVETYHTYFEEYAAHYLPWLPAPVLRMLARRLSRKLCHEVDHLIVPTDEMIAVLRRYGIRTPATVLPTGIDLDEFSGGDGKHFRAAMGLRDDQPVVATVSAFVIAGEGPDAKRLRALAASHGLSQHVLFVGNLDRRTTLLDCYRAADVFLFASPTETQGLVLIEAMALGVPIVSTAVMGTATVLRDAHGAVTSEEDPEIFAAHVARVLRDDALRASLAAAGPRDAQAWSHARLMQRVLEVYAGARPAAASPALPLQERA